MSGDDRIANFECILKYTHSFFKIKYVFEFRSIFHFDNNVYTDAFTKSSTYSDSNRRNWLKLTPLSRWRHTDN